MPLTSGTRLGPYEILAALGAGGMGEVFHARDTRLGRDVAIKALPDAFAQDPERLARFEREAKLLASLSHTNVAGIHGLELVEGNRYLVLEFVEGETLAARLARGPLPVGEAVDVCRQVAAGVEAAHESGVVHRDLKPGNVMLRPDGTVKVLDFGLAKGGAAHGAMSSDPNLSASPTRTYAATSAGVILGTAAYMSPEQARGRAVDRRTDIWSFGCVLYECLAGRSAFEGETVSDMVARILEREPDWSALPAMTPPWLRELLRRCLTKDVKQRLQAIGEARIALEGCGEGDGSAPADARPGTAGRFAWAPWTLAAVLGTLLVARTLLPGLGAPPAPERHVELGLPAGQGHLPTSLPLLSPDGRRVVVAATDSARVPRLWVRSLDEFDFHAIQGTEGALMACWSPDSRSLGFIADGSLSRVSVDDGTIQKLAPDIGAQRGLDWGANGSILYTPGANASIWRVPATGGAPVQVTHLDTTLVDASHRFPVWLPDGRHFLFALWSNNARVLSESGGIYLASVDGGEPKRISPDVGAFLVLPSGYLVVARNSDMVAVPFDLRTFRVGTQAIPIAGRVGLEPSTGFLRASASASGDIAFEAEAELPLTDMVWLDRFGRRGEALELRTKFESVELSPDGGRVAASMTDATGMSEIWTADLTRKTVSRLSRDENDSFSPVWSPDGARIAFNNLDTGTEDVYVQLASGTRPKERIWRAGEADASLSGWSSDGRHLFFTGNPRTGSRRAQVWAVELANDSAHVVLAGDYDQSDAVLSPDGRWLAYTSNESGQPEVFVRSYPDLERKWQASITGGVTPHWRRDGRELVFSSGPGADRATWAVSIATTGAGLIFGQPQRLFRLPADVVDLSPAPDHTKFLALIQPAASVEPAMRLVLGWRAERRK
jgi:Tol biopolymer transport system component